MRYGTSRKLVGVDRGVDVAALTRLLKCAEPVKVSPDGRTICHA